MIGELLRLYRNVHNIGVREFSKRIGVSAATISRIERGKPMNHYTMLKLIMWLFNKRATG